MCSILDLARDPARKNITIREQSSSLTLLHQVGQGKLRSVVSDRVVNEFERNIDTVQAETEASVSSILSGVDQFENAKLRNLAALFGIDSSDPQQILIDYATVTSASAKKWLNDSITLEEAPEDLHRANSRVINKLAPAHRAQGSFADCVILESYLSFALGCYDTRGSPTTKIFFVSSNIRDFTRYGVLHKDISERFDPLGVRYARSMYDVRLLLTPD